MSKISKIRYNNTDYDISDNYSTEETIIGTWIDGKPLYRKVIDTTTPSSANTDNVVATFSSDYNVINFYGSVYIVNQLHSINMYYDSTHSISTYIQVSDNSIHCKCTGYIAENPMKIIIEYTKTTD